MYKSLSTIPLTTNPFRCIDHPLHCFHSIEREKAKEPLYLDMPCACGSGDLAGECCGGKEPCSCGSGERAAECCYQSMESYAT